LKKVDPNVADRFGQSGIGKKLKHENLEETKHGLFRNCFLGAPECTRNREKSPI